MPTRWNRGFYCRSYCLHNMFQGPLCPSSGAQEYHTVVAACGISCCGFQVVGLVWSWGLCVRFAGCCSILQTGHITLRSVASSWHFISTYPINKLGDHKFNPSVHDINTRHTSEQRKLSPKITAYQKAVQHSSIQTYIQTTNCQLSMHNAQLVSNKKRF